jgi:uncharacterized membrane protein
MTSVFGLPIADAVALTFSLVMWFAFAIAMDHSPWRERSLTAAVNAQRFEWMLRLTNRENRVNDGSLIGNLMRSISFFASATIIILGGVTASLGAIERGYDATRVLPFLPVVSKELFEVKLLLVGLVFIYSFFKFTWSLRQFNYCCILLGGAPSPGDPDEEKQAFAKRAARVNELGARSFNQGLRGYYFALATLGWFIHPAAFSGSTVWVVWILWRREFRSKTRLALRGH